jgi:hypothetical protein
MEDFRPWSYPPPEAKYDTFDEAEHAVLQWASQYGYGLRRGRSKLDKKGDTRKMWMQCDRARSAEPSGTIRTYLTTRGVNCGFFFQIVRYPSKDNRWYIVTNNSTHCHDPSVHPSAHPCFRHRTSEVRALIRRQTELGIAPATILATVQELNTGALLSIRDIYNERLAYKVDQLRGMTPTEALVMILEDRLDEWEYTYTTDGDGRLTILFIANKQSIKLAHAYPDVVLMDATYKTNKYRMPLLHIMGVVPVSDKLKYSNGSNFLIGFAFLSGETEDEYYTVLQMLKDYVFYDANNQPEVFCRDGETALGSALEAVYPEVPQLVCLWHVEKNVLKKAKEVWVVYSDYTDEEKEQLMEKRDNFIKYFTELCRSNTKEDFEKSYRQLKSDYSTEPALIEYLDKHQYPQRHLIVKAWTAKVRHFGNATISRLEGGHSQLKRFIKHSCGDLFDVFKDIRNMIASQINNLTAKLATASVRRRFATHPKNVQIFTQELVRTIVPQALDLAL